MRASAEMAFSLFAALVVTLSIGVHPTVGQTVVRTLDATSDTTLERPGTRHGSLVFNIVGAHTGFPIKRTLLGFPTPAALDGMSIVCARVEMYFAYAHRASFQPDEPWVDRNITVGAMLVPWSESGATSTHNGLGFTFPTNYLTDTTVVEPSTESTHTICRGNSSHWSAFDVTAIARGWSSGNAANNGLIIWATNERVNGRDIRFASTEYRNSSLHPVLRVAYTSGTTQETDCSMFEDFSNICEGDVPTTTTAVQVASSTSPVPSPTIAPTIENSVAVADTFLEAPTSRWGSFGYNIVGAHTGFPVKRTLVRFETPRVFEGMSIACARVEMYFDYAHRASNQPDEPWIDRNISIGAMQIPWSESLATSATNGLGSGFPTNLLTNPAYVQPSTETSHQICEGNRSHWSSWDVTRIVKDWAYGDVDNYGVILWATNEQINGRDIRFASREATNQTLRPVLRVAYVSGSTEEIDCSMFEDFSNTCESPTTMPTAMPTAMPSASPTAIPTSAPATSTPTSSNPSTSPTRMPSTSVPTPMPSQQPSTNYPTMVPSSSPTSFSLQAVIGSNSDSGSTTTIAIGATVAIVIAIIIAAVFLVMFRRKEDNVNPTSFENPMYDSSTTDQASGNAYADVTPIANGSAYVDVAPEGGNSGYSDVMPTPGGSGYMDVAPTGGLDFMDDEEDV